MCDKEMAEHSFHNSHSIRSLGSNRQGVLTLILPIIEIPTITALIFGVALWLPVFIRDTPLILRFGSLAPNATNRVA